MGVVYFKTNLTNISKHPFIRFDVKNKKIDSSNYFKSFVYLDEVFKIIKGNSYTKYYVDYKTSKPFIRIADLSFDGGIQTNNLIYLEENCPIPDEKITKKNDLILATIGATIGKISIVNDMAGGTFSNNTVLLRLKDKKEYNPVFLEKLLQNKIIQSFIWSSVSQKSQPNLQDYDLKKIKLPKIPIQKQNEIADKITPIEKEIKQLRESKKDVLEIINEVFANYYNYNYELWKEFGKGMTAGTQKSYSKTFKTYKIPFSQIEKSKTLRFSSRFHNPITQKLTNILYSKPVINIKKILIKKVHRGTTPKYDLNGTILVVKTTHLKNEYIVISDEEFVSKDFYIKKNNAQIKLNNVLIASTGKVSLGKIDIVNTDIQLIADSHISIIRVNENKYSPLFLTYFLRSILGVFQIERDYTGATNQIELYADEIENFNIPYISINEQIQIVEKIKSKIDEQKNIDKQIQEKQNKIDKIITELIKINPK